MANLDKYLLAGYDKESRRKDKTKIDSTMLLMIDFQDKLASQISEFDQITQRSVILKKAFDLHNLKTVITEQYPKGLGRSDKRILEVISDKDLLIDKTSFDAYTKEVKDFIVDNEIKDVVVVGAETHVCVYQTVRSLLEDDLNVFVVEDAVSSFDSKQRKRGFKNMRDMGAIVVNSEIILFDLVKSKEGKHFKEISNFVKEIRKIK